MAENNDQESSPFGEEPSGGRYLLGGLFVAAGILLALIGNQTVRGDMGEAARSGGWWAEPALAPGVALVLTIVASAVAFLSARKEEIDWSKAARDYGGILLITGCMVTTVYLMKILGFALSLLVFAFVVSLIGGFRGIKLIAISLGAAIAMVLIFRVGFGVWFPRPALFKWIDLPFGLQGIL